MEFPSVKEKFIQDKNLLQKKAAANYSQNYQK